MTRNLAAMRYLAVLFLVSIGGTAAFAQAQTDTTPYFSKGTIGLILDGSMNMHQANFQKLPDVPSCCPTYGNGSGLGGQFGFFYDRSEEHTSELQSPYVISY